MCTWLFTILRNLFRSEQQHSRVEFEEFRDALARVPSVQRKALLLVSAPGFSYEEAAEICESVIRRVIGVTQSVKTFRGSVRPKSRRCPGFPAA
jgi:DNA-directed RNA polymerase specialized sigma24 family protein